MPAAVASAAGRRSSLSASVPAEVPSTPPRMPTRAQLASDSTPDARGDFPHYCPICMMSFRRVLNARCCNNTICEVCAAELIEAHVAKAPLQRALRRTTAYQSRLEQQRRQHQQRLGRGGGGSNTRGGAESVPNPFTVAAAPKGPSVDDDPRPEDLSDPALIFLADCNATANGGFEPVVPLPCPFCTRTITLEPVLRRAQPPVPETPPRAGVPGSLFGDTPPPRSAANAAAFGGRSFHDSPAVASSSRLAAALPTPPRPVTSLHDVTPKAKAGRPGSAQAQASAGRHQGLRVQIQCGAYSPVKAGDEFEALRRKLRPLGSIDPNSVAGKEHAANQKRHEEEAQRYREEQAKALALAQQKQALRGPAVGRPPLRPAAAPAAVKDVVPRTSRNTSSRAQQRSTSTSRSNAAQSSSQAPATSRREAKKKDEGFSCVVM